MILGEAFGHLSRGGGNDIGSCTAREKVGCLEAELRGLLEWCDRMVVKVRIIDRDGIS